MSDRSSRTDDIEAEYVENETERMVIFHRGEAMAVIAQNAKGYAMLAVRTAPDGDELERYYGFDMALDHVAELLGVNPASLPVPDAAEDMGI